MDWICNSPAGEAVVSSFPAAAGKGDHLAKQDGGTGAGGDVTLRWIATTKLEDYCFHRGLLLRRKRSFESSAPSTALRAVPLPRYRGRRMSACVLATRLRPSHVARMERSEIRERWCSLHAAPGLRYAPSGLRRKEKGKRSADRRTSHWPHRIRGCRHPPNASGAAATPAGAARLSALRSGSRLATECFDSAQAALHASGRERALPAPSPALKRSTSHPGP
jgi:hypothetical protein